MKPTHLIVALLFSISLSAQTNIQGIINHYAKVSALDTCFSRITVNDTTGFATGVKVLLIQMKGAVINTADDTNFGTIADLANCGRYEQNMVDSVQGNFIYLHYRPKFNYDPAGYVQIVDIVQYSSATVVGGRLSCKAWDGESGGILALEVSGQLTLNNHIDVSYKGFRGGVAEGLTSDCNSFSSYDAFYYALGNYRGSGKGEGIAITIPGKENGRGALGSGGGGGNDHNSGGGGGGNVKKGGRGGINDEPGTFNCHGDYPGIGAKAVVNTQGRIFLGGGGGAGHRNNNNNSDGGNGGGIVYLQAGTIVGNNRFIAANGDSCDIVKGDGAGGGGAGGTILLDVTQVTGNLIVRANGGDGGNANNNNQNRCFGPGGGGSGGRIINTIAALPNVTLEVNPGQPGITFNSTNGCDGSNNGAQTGDDGQIQTFSSLPMGNMPILAPAFTLQPQPVSICEGQNATFSVAASGDNLSYQWQQLSGSTFINVADNGTFNGSQTPTLHITNAPALLSNTIFRCQVSGDACFAAISSSLVMLNVLSDPQASFSYNANGLNVLYENLSTGGNSYQWQFGDNMSSNQTSPDHVYAQEGFYVVILTATNSCGASQDTMLISLFNTPQATISSNVTSGCAPLSVQYLANSLNVISSWSWQFPGGTPYTSSVPNPVVTYNTPGQYGVVLIVTNNAGSDTIIMPDYISVYANPVAAFSTQANMGSVIFTNNSSNATGFNWNFGDLSNSTLDNPTHTYLNEGNYPVTLIASSFCGSDTLVQTVNIQIPPTAGFNVGATSGCMPFVVSFQNASSANALTFNWYFQGGNPGSSNLPNPQVTYSNAGTYDVRLIVSNNSGSDTLDLPGYITVLPDPVAAFSSQANMGSVIFTNNSSNATGFNWNFGDLSNSTLDNPTHTYLNEGNYPVTLIASNACGTDTLVQIVNIQIPPVAGMNVGVTNGCTPFVVNFQNASSANTLNFNWYFQGGNPGSSNLPSPQVTYNNPGIFDVRLIVSNNSGSDTLDLPGYITVGMAPTVSFSNVVNGNTALFSNNSSGAFSYLWNFGDNTTSTDINPAHTYASAGSYIVTLTAHNDCGSVSFQDIIVIAPPPAATVTANPLNGCAPLVVQFNGNSNSNVSSWNWQFPGGNPGVSTDQFPVVTYLQSGIYDVTLTVSNANGTTVIEKPAFIQVGDGPVSDFDFSIDVNVVSFTNQSSGGTNFQWNFGDNSLISNEVNPVHTYVHSGVYSVTLLVLGEYCGSGKTRLVYIDPSATEDPEADSGIGVFPNPTSGRVTLRFPEGAPAAEVRVFDTAARELRRIPSISGVNNIIDLSEFPAGVYLLQIQWPGKVVWKKVVRD